MAHNLFETRRTFEAGGGKQGTFYSLPALEKAGVGNVSRLPISIRIVLESVLRNFDEGEKIGKEHVEQLAKWQATAERTDEVPFVVSRVILQDFTGVPLLVDLAAMRSAVERAGKDVNVVEPLVPVDLVIDHSVQVDFAGSEAAYQRNMEKEFERNEQRYRFLKWGMQAFNGFRVVPPGIGIVHQVNLEYLAKGVFEKDGTYYPDTLVGTDSHTTMINGLGIVGWGVGGIEAEAAMLGQPVYILTPDVVGMNLYGELPQGATATDLVLRVTEILREAKVVGKFVEFFGEGTASLPATDRATIANMSPEYGATMGFFGIDEKTLDYFAATGRSDEQIETIRNYYQAQEMFGIPLAGDVDYTKVIDLDLASVKPAVAGPKRPQDRIDLERFSDEFKALFTRPVSDGGFGRDGGEFTRLYDVSLNGGDAIRSGGGEQDPRSIPLPVIDGQSAAATSVETEAEMANNRPTPDVVSEDDGFDARSDVEIGHGSVLIAAITSCTNTSNPSVMLAAGLLAKKAVEKGLSVPSYVKTSLAPGSRVVTDYLEKTGLQDYLDKIGFDLVGYGCTTCIGNSGPLHPAIENAVVGNDLVAASVLSGNRNFEARVHQNIKANFLMSPPLVVAFALSGTVNTDLSKEAIATDRDGNEVYLKDIWPTLDEIREMMHNAFEPEVYRKLYSDFAEKNPMWNDIPSTPGKVYEWDESSTYIQEPPYFDGFTMEAGTFEDVEGARPLAVFGDSVTTDHISPAGAIKADSPAGLYLQSRGVEPTDFNSYGSRRGNDHVMLRGTFANVRIKNRLVSPKEGGFTVHHPSGEEMTIYDAAMKYGEEGVPLVILAGAEYGTGSSRDWAAKGTLLMGVKAVVAKSFERIHRSNLIGMGVLPLQFKDADSVDSLGIDGTETYDLVGLSGTDVRPLQEVSLKIHKKDGSTAETDVILRIDTPVEADYYRHGGILPYVLRQLIAG
ncbi:MAG: aconitate hydratase [Acidobacteria bacterium]|nr:MAG: aconitate hydratase [Acidobacteriota bacterium]REK01628.1 MAG: aconitate hydratase [Acidobacteriota bacterium]REK14584.1 MAG: aconitate hydratase [Acidobacteriota bacterium]REK45299.1 MAG: aconitate hydratase [Acidobacteriota bacterium]